MKYHDEMEKEVLFKAFNESYTIRPSFKQKEGMELYSYLKKNPYIQKDNIAPFVKAWNRYEMGDLIEHNINIVKTNELRIFINHQKMLEYKDDDSSEISPSENNETAKNLVIQRPSSCFKHYC
jgi:hypothetical protein